MRPLAYLRAAYGAALLAAPEALLRELPHARVDSRARVFARVLGTRQLAEAWLLAGRTRGASGTGRARVWWSRAGSAVDAAHAGTMLALAVALPDRRRLALANAAVAVALTWEGLREG